MVETVGKSDQKLKWSELPDGFQTLLKRSYGEYKEILYDPYLHPRARKVPSWDEWLDKHDIVQDGPPDIDTQLNPPNLPI